MATIRIVTKCGLKLYANTQHAATDTSVPQSQYGQWGLPATPPITRA